MRSNNRLLLASILGALSFLGCLGCETVEDEDIILQINSDEKIPRVDIRVINLAVNPNTCSGFSTLKEFNIESPNPDNREMAITGIDTEDRNMSADKNPLVIKITSSDDIKLTDTVLICVWGRKQHNNTPLMSAAKLVKRNNGKPTLWLIVSSERPSTRLSHSGVRDVFSW